MESPSSKTRPESRVYFRFSYLTIFKEDSCSPVESSSSGVPPFLGRVVLRIEVPLSVTISMAPTSAARYAKEFRV